MGSVLQIRLGRGGLVEKVILGKNLEGVRVQPRAYMQVRLTDRDARQGHSCCIGERKRPLWLEWCGGGEEKQEMGPNETKW